MNPIIPKVWVTKYALTKGVFTFENVEICDDPPTMILLRTAVGWTTYYHKPDWHTTPKEARKRVEQIFSRRRKSLQRSLDRLKDDYLGVVNSIK